MEHSELHLISTDRRACRGEYPRLQTRFESHVTCRGCKANIVSAATVAYDTPADVPIVRAIESIYEAFNSQPSYDIPSTPDSSFDVFGGGDSGGGGADGSW